MLTEQMTRTRLEPAEKDGDKEGVIEKKTVLWFHDDMHDGAASLWFV